MGVEWEAPDILQTVKECVEFGEDTPREQRIAAKDLFLAHAQIEALREIAEQLDRLNGQLETVIDGNEVQASVRATIGD